MSVRRLADEAVQPDAFAFSADNAAWAEAKLKDYPEGRQASAVIPLLMRAQEQDGWVTRAAIEHVAEMLDMPLIRVLEVATFYTQFQLAPVGKRAHVQVCGTTPCMLRGAGELMDVCKKRIAPNQFEISADGNLSWEEVECQGACVNAPMIMIFKDTYEDLTPERLEEIIDAFDRGDGASIQPGPQIERVYSAPEGGLTSLKEQPHPSRHRDGGSVAEEQAATIAGRPASHVGLTSEAVDTPVGQKKSAEAAAEAKKARKSSGTRSPKKRLEAEAAEEGIGGRGGVGKPATAKKASSSSDKSKGTEKAAKSGGKSKAASVVVGEATKATASKSAGMAKTTVKGSGSKVSKAASAKAENSVPAGIADLQSANRPEAIERPDEVDDLKMISGIGPKIEGILHGLGIYTFAQVASWKKKEREWVDGYLRFKGRIEREDWVKQAKALAKSRA